MELHFKRKNCNLALLFFLLLILLSIQVVLSATQLTFTLNLDDSIFRYEENALNNTNITEDLIFTGNENITRYITIPKNSTILWSNITLAGESSPSQTYATDEVWSLVVGDVDTSTSDNEIAVAVTNGINLLNSTGSQIWSYSVSGTSVYDVAIGNISIDEGNEVVAGSGSGDYMVYVINSSGNQVWNYSVSGQIVYTVDVGNVNVSTSENEIVVGIGNNTIYLLNSTGDEIWDYYSGLSGSMNGLAIGNVSTDEGNEIVGGSSDNRVYVINSSGNQVWNVSISSGINDVDVGDVDSSVPGNEIAVAAGDKKVYLLNSTGSELWSYITSASVDTVVIGDVTSDTGNEVVAGSNDNKVYVLNSTGDLVWSHTTNNWVRGLDIGNITVDEGNEVIAGTRDQSPNINIYILNFEYYPTNLSLDVGGDGDYDWNYSETKLRESTNVTNSSITPEIQNFLSSCGTQNCDVPLVFHSDAGGDLNITSINITYDYNASEAISYNTLTETWSRTNNTNVNESVGYEVKNVSYGTPANSIQVRYVKINDTATQCDFAEIHYSSNTTVDGQNVCNVSDYSITSGDSHFLWDNNMNTSIPTYMNETGYSLIGGLQKKNMTIWNVTPTVFYNVTANTTINETLIKYNKTLKVIWNEEWCDITPSNEDSNCNESSPSYTAKECGSDYFYVCKKDLSGSSGVDFFKWKQPHTSETIYELSGSDNVGANLTNANVSPTSDVWGNNFTFSVNVTDSEDDNVTVSLWIYLTNLGVWQEMESKNTTSNITETPETVEFNVTSNKTWTGSNKYKFRYRDFNASDILHDWQFTDEYTNWEVTKHNVTIKYIIGNNTDVNRTSGNVSFIIQVNDTNNNSNPVGEGINCSFWITNDTASFDSGHSTVTNSSGHCNYTFDPDSTYSANQQTWIGGAIDNAYYNDQNSTNFTVNVYGQLNINLTGSILNQNFTRRENITIEAKLYDEFNSIVEEDDYNCTFYVFNSTNDIVNTTNTTTNTSGHCNFTWYTNCSNTVGVKTVNVTLSGNASTYYFIEKNNHTANTTLKDNLNVTIINPQNESIVHEQGTITLNSTVSDPCGCPEESYNVSWYFVKDVLCPTANPVAIGDNTTWDINATCSPRQQIVIANATGDFYSAGKDNVTIYIYGWSTVDIISPTSGSEINRSEVGEATDIVCYVDSTTNGGIGNYPVNFYQRNESSYEVYIGSNTTNTSVGAGKGYAIYRWNITNSSVPDGYYNITCNITDNSTLYYNVSVNNDTALNVWVFGNPDVNAPNIISVTATSVEVYQNTTINASITDLYGVDKVWIDVTYPNKTSTSTFNLEKIWGTIKNGNWSTSFNLTDRGEYNFTLYVNDTSNNTNSTTGWFEAYLPIRFYGNTTDSSGNNVSVDFTFYRNGTNEVIHHFLTNTSNAEYNETVRNRTFDIEVKVFNHTVKFFSVNMTENSVNSVKNFDTFSTSIYDIIGVRNYLKTLMIESTLNYSSVNLTMNYSDVFSIYDDATYPHTFIEADLDIYKCSNFTLPGVTFNCSSGWVNLNVDPNRTTHTITANFSTLSGFILGDTADPNDGVCDRGETCAYDSICCAPEGNGGTTGGSGGGGGGGITPECGNGICEAGENVYNCPEDCGSSEIMFSLWSNLTNVELNAGEKRTYALRITNNVKYAINASISIVGTANEFIDLEKNFLTVESETKELVMMYVTIPEGTDPGTYTGEIFVRGDGKTKSIPLTIRISLKSAVNLDLVVESLNKRVGLNETARFQITLIKSGAAKVDGNFTYLIKEFETGEKIYEEKESREILSQYRTILKSIPLGTINITAGHYFFEVVVNYGKLTTASDDFYVVLTFWTSDRITQIALIVSVVTAIIAVYYGRKRYILWKVSKARYIFPMDMRKLPRGKIWLGKIAETRSKAYFTMDELKTHILTAGATGSGKSVSASIFVEELLEEKIPIIVFDPTAQWTGFVRPCRDPKLIKYYKEFGLSRADARPYTGMIYEVTDPNVKIDFKKYMNPGEITVFTLNKLKPGEYDDAVRNIIDTIFAQGWEESTKLRMVIVFDEVHRLLEKYGGKGGYVSLERACREFRKWGIGLIMASQVLSDFKEAIKGNVLTEVQLHTKSLGDLGRVEKKYGLEYAKKVTKLEVGVGLMQNPRYNEGRPWFVSFRPTLHSPHKIPDQDMKTYKEYAAILEKIESKIKSMEESGIDVFDLKTEFRLANEKLKKGRFRMAKIYIDSLKKHLIRE